MKDTTINIFHSAILTTLLLFCAGNINSQNIEKSTYIRTTDNAILYKLYKDEINETNSTDRRLISLENRKKKLLKKATDVELLDITNNKAEFIYDAYLVKHKKETYCIPKEFVQSNQYIDSINNVLRSEYSNLTARRDYLKKELQNQIAYHTSISKERLDTYQKRKEQLPGIIDSLERKAANDYSTKRKNEFKKRYQSWYNSLPISARNAAKAISIEEAYLLSPNSAGGCDFIFKYINKSSKTIKYLHWNGWVYNAVDDMVACEIRGRSSVGGKDTGPVLEGEGGGGNWSCIIYNYSARSVRISSIRIIYMDNSSITINEADIKRLMNVPQEDGYDWYGADAAKKTASAAYKKELNECNDSIRTLKNRIKNLERNKGFTNPYDDKNYSFLYNQLSNIQQEIDDAEAAITAYEYKNFMNESRNISIISEEQKKTEELFNNEKENKKVTFGTGFDFLISDEYLGFTIPIELLFGSLNNYVNLSISGEYTFLNGHNRLFINKFGTFATLHINFGQDDIFRYPLSVGIGYSGNLGNKTYNVAGWYYDNSYKESRFSFPITMNSGNFSSIISWGIRTRHWKAAAFMRFDITPVFDRSQKENNIPEGETIFYDDNKIEDLLNCSDNMPLFGFFVRYYF